MLASPRPRRPTARIHRLDDPDEPPLNPEVECHTGNETLAESVENVLEYVLKRLSR